MRRSVTMPPVPGRCLVCGATEAPWWHGHGPYGGKPYDEATKGLYCARCTDLKRCPCYSDQELAEAARQLHQMSLPL